MAKTHICLTVSKSCHAGKTVEESQAMRSEHWEVGATLEEAISKAQGWIASNRGAVLVSCHVWKGKERIALDIQSRKVEPSKRAMAIPKDARVIPAKVGDSIPSALIDLLPGLSLSTAGYPLYHERRIFQRTDIPGTLVELGTWQGVRLACRKDGKASYSWLVIRKPDKAPAHTIAGWERQTAKQGAQLVVRRHKRPE